MKNKMPTIFICYSHAQYDLFSRLLPSLNIAAEETGFEIWFDDKMMAGEKWHPRIGQQIDRARVAILFVSQQFLNSTYIQKHERPRIMNRAEEGGLDLIGVKLDDCDCIGEDFSKYQWANARHTRPLMEIDDEDEFKHSWDLACDRIRERLEEVMARVRFQKLLDDLSLDFPKLKIIERLQDSNIVVPTTLSFAYSN